MSGKFSLLPSFVKISIVNANSEDPYQTPRSAAFDQGLLSLPVSLLYDARLKYYKCVPKLEQVHSAIRWYVLNKLNAINDNMIY